MEVDNNAKRTENMTTTRCIEAIMVSNCKERSEYCVELNCVCIGVNMSMPMDSINTKESSESCRGVVFMSKKLACYVVGAKEITTRVDRWEVTCKVSSFEFGVFGSEIANAHFTFLRSAVVVHGLHSFTDNEPQPARSMSLSKFRVRPAICVVSPQFQQSDRFFVTEILLTRAVL